MKTRIVLCVSAAVVGGTYFVTRHVLKDMDSLEIAPTPQLNPHLQEWLKYVEKYPHLEDDPKVKNAIELLEKYHEK